MRKLLLALFLLAFATPAFAAEKESAFARVMRTGVLRCGYQLYPPYMSKDLKTGAFGGVYADIFEELAKQAGLKINWAEEEGSDTVFTGLAAGRYDAFCSPITATPARARVGLFTTPLVYVPFYVYVRANDTRFDGKDGYAHLNAPGVSFATKDGDLIEILARQYFPATKKISSGGITDVSQMMLSVADGKADAIVEEPVYAGVFLRNNPGKLKRADVPEPLQVFPATAAAAIGEHDMLAFLNTSLQSLADEGFIKATLKKHIANSEDIFPANKPYEMKK